MARTACDVCPCVDGNTPIDTYRQNVQIVLCGILAALESGALDQDVNLVGILGVAPTVNNGAVGAGSLRVTIANNSTGVVGLNAGANIIGSLAANQSVNVAQVAGTATSVGNGAVDAGTIRVTVANNSTGTTAVTMASGAVASGAYSSGSIASGAYASGALASGSVASGALAAGSIAAGAVAAGALSFVKLEDVAHVTGDAGVPSWGVANIALTTFSADNDYTPTAVDLQGRVLVTSKSVLGNVNNVSASVTNVTIIAANSSRTGATVYNDSSSILYLKLGATASATSFTVKMQPEAYYEVPFGYYGIIDGIWVAAVGAARFEEFL